MAEKNTSDEILEAFMAQSGPEKVGKNHMKNKWQAIFLLITCVPFLLILIDSSLLNWILFGYGLLIIAALSFFIGIVKSVMMYDINPFDYVFIQFTNFLVVVLQFGFLFYLLYLNNSNNFSGHVTDLNLIDFVYYSTITISTVGYGDIVPISKLTKLVVIAELVFGMWFLITVIPVAISLQAERMFHFGNKRNDFFSKVQEGIKNGTLVPGETFETKKGKGRI